MVDERRTTMIVTPPGSEVVARFARELARLGHDVIEAADWQAALDAADGRPPDIVVFDPRVSAAGGPSRQSALAQLQARHPDLVVIGLGGADAPTPSGGEP